MKYLPLAVLFLWSTCALGQQNDVSNDWMQFRGPDFNPTSNNADLPDRWSTDENVDWSATLEGRGWSSPIVVGKKVFVTTAVADGDVKPPQAGTEYSNDYVRELMKQGLDEEQIKQKIMERDFQLKEETTLDYYLVCLDLNSGKKLWQQKFHTGNPPGGSHRKNSFASETPTSDGKHVFVYVGNLGIYAYDLDGKAKWKKNLEPKPMYMEFGTGTSPVVCDGKLIVVSDNEEASFIAAYDSESGKEVWKTERKLPESAPAALPKSGWATPLVWKNSQRTEIVTMQPGTAISYDVDGKELWRLNGCTAAPSASSFAKGDHLFLNGGRGRPFFVVKPGAKGVIEWQKEDEADPNRDKLVWKRPRTGTYIPTPVVYQGGLYIVQDSGILQRLDAETGNESYKKRIKESGADFTTSPWAYNGKVFCLSEQGDTYVYEAGDTFKLSHVNSLGEFTMASPAIAGDRLLIRTEKKLYCLRKNEKG